MPKKGHTCCVLGCTVNSKKTQLADGGRPRFFCFPHEKKRPHLRRAWLALTRRTEASTNTRVCEFHFVDSKPSSVNPHPILNMGMEATKMQKRAMELRQQKELRKLIMQQQMAGILNGQPLPGQLLSQNLGGDLLPEQQMLSERGGLGVQMIGLDEMMGGGGMNQHQGGFPQMDNTYGNNIRPKLEDDQNNLPSQIGYNNNPLANPVPLVTHNRPTEGMDEASMAGSIGGTNMVDTMASNGDLIESGLVQPVTDYDAVDDSLISNSDSNQSYNPHAADDLPEDCAKYIPFNPNSENLTPPSIDDYTSTSSNDTKVTDSTTNVINTKDNGLNLMSNQNGQTDSTIDLPSQERNDGDLPMITNSYSLVQNSVPLANQNGVQVVDKPGLSMVSQNGIPTVSPNGMPVHTSTPLKIPLWRLATVNGTTSTTPSGTPAAKKPRKRKSTVPHMKYTKSNGPDQIKPVVYNNQYVNNAAGSIPGLKVPTQPKTITQSNILMSMHTVEGLKSDILENLRAEFLTELRNESESNKQLKAEMETIRMQTRQELQQMRVELHALWGENQRLRAQVENLNQDKEGHNFITE